MYSVIISFGSPVLLICLNCKEFLKSYFFILDFSYYLCTRFSEIDR